MPKKKGARSRAKSPSALSDSATPGGPTSMDIMLGWLTVPGNVARWRSGNRAALSREVVQLMRDAGIAHRQAPYVRYKLDALDKQYISAKQWLLETGMHDEFLRGKAAKEVKAHVQQLCPAFVTLDPVMTGVAFSKKNEEPIELDGDSTEDNTDVREELAVSNSAESDADDAGSSSGEEYQDAVAMPLFEKETAKAEEKAKGVGKEKSKADTLKPAASAQEKPAESVQKKRLGRPPKVVLKDASAKPTTRGAKSPLNAAASAAKAALREDNAQQTTKEAKRKSVGKAAASAPRIYPPTSAAKPKTTKPTATTKAIVTARPVTAAEPTIAANSANATKRKTHEKSTSPVKRTRTHEANETTQEELDQLERGAAIKRVKDEEKQRHEIFELERAKMECELEAKQVQLLFEKAAARKKLVQMGFSVDEVNRILPL